MKFLRAAAARVVGLFVTDWVQSVVVVVIIAAAWLAVARLGTAAVVVFVALLASQLVWFAVAAARRGT
jgi:hypothetical protein